jgi:hypothetical protein
MKGANLACFYGFFDVAEVRVCVRCGGQFLLLSNLGSMLLCTTSDNRPFYWTCLPRQGYCVKIQYRV